VNKLKTYLPVIMAACVALGIILGSYLNLNKRATTFLGMSNNKSEAKIKRLINFIQYDYVDKVDTDSLLDDAITSMLSKLDPHSVYLPAKRRKEVDEEMDGKFVGVGIRFLMFKDSLTVSKVIPNGPSAKAGIMPGDRILIANKDTLFGKNLKSNLIIKTLKGKKGTKVVLRVYRKVTHKFFTTTVTRDDVPIKSLDASYMINDSLGYIKLNKFSATSYTEFHKALVGLEKQGMKALVFDLRGNPGGYLHIAIKIADEFLSKGQLIVSTKNKGGRVEKSFATAKGDFKKAHVFVLIDEGSASASEIVSGAIQDNDRGLIMGRRTFGKGLVQQPINLEDGSEMRLTVSRYYTPTGRCIQKPYGDGIDYYNDILNRYENGELQELDSAIFENAEKFTTPKGRIVYGGGGIMPDLFIPIDTIGTSLYLSNLAYSPAYRDFCFDYVDKNRNLLNYKDVKSFNAEFKITEELFNTFVKYVDKEHGVSPDPFGIRASKERIKNQLKSEFATYLWDEEARFYISIPFDHDIQVAIEELND